MIDLELKKFYDSVKDSAWPDINTYNDFKKLPKSIQQECYQLHNFQHRKNQIENPEHWAQVTGHFLQSNNLAYAPVPKCAMTYYRHLFCSMGWQATKNDKLGAQPTVIFGLIMHPFTRWVKGITEFLVHLYTESNHPGFETNSNNVFVEDVADWDRFMQDYEQGYIKKIINHVCVLDTHTMPYSTQFGRLLDEINWIPMDVIQDDTAVKLCINALFEKHDCSARVPLHDNQRAWASSPEKKKIENIVRQHLKTSHLETSQNRFHNLYKLYAADLKFYHNLVDTFDPTWKTTKIYNDSV
jgi:hypothetical protein